MLQQSYMAYPHLSINLYFQQYRLHKPQENFYMILGLTVFGTNSQIRNQKQQRIGIVFIRKVSGSFIAGIGFWLQKK